jgi:hypothetical protein
MAAKLIFVDPAAAAGGNGLKDTPYNTTALGVTACNTAENVLHLRRGRVYAPPAASAGLWFSNHAPAGFTIVKSYGDEEMPPTLFGGMRMLPGDPGWSYVGAGLWKRAITSNANYAGPYGMRLYVGSRILGAAANNSLGTGYEFGKAVARYPNDKADTEAQILAYVDSDGLQAKRLWMYTRDSGGYLYVFTGSATIDPPTYYGGITLVGSNNLTDANGMGRAYGAAMFANTTCKNILVTEVDSIYAAASSFRVLSTGASTNQDNGFANCRGYAFGANGLMTVGTSLGSVVRATARDMLIDAVATLDEDWNFRDKFGIAWLNGSQDATVLGPYTADNTFERVRTLDGYHLNTLIGTMSSASKGTVNGRLIDCSGDNSNRAYGTLLVGSILGAGNVAVIDRFRGENAVSFISRTGDGKMCVNDAHFSNGKAPFPVYSRALGMEPPLALIPGIGVFSNAGAYGTMEDGCLTLNRSTFMNPYGFMFAIEEFGGQPMVANTVRANDCLLYDRTYLDNISARSFGYEFYPKPGLSIDGRGVSSGATGYLNLANCYYWTGAAAQPRVGTTNSVSVGLGSWVGLAAGSTFSEADPKVDALGYLLDGSPLKYTLPLTAPAYDVDGRMRNNPTSVGAREFVESRYSRI